MNYSKRQLKRKPSREFGEYLTRLREQRTKLIQAEAARQLCLSRQELNYFEKGVRAPPDSLLINLAHLYHVPTGEVLERAYWPQLILVPLIAIIDPKRLSRELIEEIEKGLEETERRELTKHIEKILRKRSSVKQH